MKDRGIAVLALLAVVGIVAAIFVWKTPALVGALLGSLAVHCGYRLDRGYWLG